MTHQERLERDKREFIAKLSHEPPEGCGLKVGDTVDWANDYGVEWRHKILGFIYGDWFADKYGKHVILDTDAYWSPHDHSTLTKVSG